MNYPYTVKYGGVYYAPGEDVPVVNAPDVKVPDAPAAAEKKLEKPKKQ